MNKCIKRYIFKYLDSNMYIYIEKGEAFIVDPHYSFEADSFLRENDVKNVIVFFTHEHFDHTSGIVWLRNNFHTTLVCSMRALSAKSQARCNKPTVIYLKMLDEGLDDAAERLCEEFPPYFYEADISFDENYVMKWHHHQIKIEALPGHSPASCMILVDNKICFTGDSVIPDIPITLRWPGSDSQAFYNSSLKKIQKLPKDVMIFPGHGEAVMFRNLLFEKGVFKSKKI